MHLPKQQNLLLAALLFASALITPLQSASAAWDEPDEKTDTANALIMFLENAQVDITVGEMYAGPTGSVNIGSASVDIPWMDSYDQERSLPEDDVFYDAEVRSRTVENLWHTGPFRTIFNRAPRYRATYSINGGTYSDRTQSVDVYNTGRTSKIKVTFTPPDIMDYCDKDYSYRLQADVATVSFSVTETTASGTYPVSITTQVKISNISSY